MYDIYIANFSFAYIFKSYLSLYEKKRNENLQLKRCVWRMRREIIIIQNKQFWRLFNYVMIKLFLFITPPESAIWYILSVTLRNIVHAYFNALDNWHHHMDFVKILCDQCNPTPSEANILYTIWDSLFFKLHCYYITFSIHFDLTGITVHVHTCHY